MLSIKPLFGCRLAPVSLVRVCCRGVTDQSKEGAIKDAGDTFSKKGEADEAAYFHKQNIEQLKKMKGLFFWKKNQFDESCLVLGDIVYDHR